jgi:hypothetical protein
LLRLAVANGGRPNAISFAACAYCESHTSFGCMTVDQRESGSANSFLTESKLPLNARLFFICPLYVFLSVFFDPSGWTRATVAARSVSPNLW